jgi:hypothetical protein
VNSVAALAAAHLQLSLLIGRETWNGGNQQHERRDEHRREPAACPSMVAQSSPATVFPTVSAGRRRR